MRKHTHTQTEDESESANLNQFRWCALYSVDSQASKLQKTNRLQKKLVVNNGVTQTKHFEN